MPSSFRLRSIKRLLAAAALSSALCAQPMVRIASTQNVLKVVYIGHNWPNTVSHKKNTRWRIQRHTPNNNEDYNDDDNYNYNDKDFEDDNRPTQTALVHSLTKNDKDENERLNDNKREMILEFWRRHELSPVWECNNGW